MARKLRLSVSSLKLYLSCGRKYFFYKHPDVAKHTDYPRLCGSTVHSHIQAFYRATKTPRPFYFQSKQSAIGAWFNRWQRAVEEAVKKGQLIRRNPDLDKEYGEIGAICIAQYWEGNIEKARPLMVEKRFEHTFHPALGLVGVMDQVRRVPENYIERHRPELMQEGLNPDYDPVVIVDLKTHRFGYDTARLKNPTEYERMREQYNLHEDLQATAYTFLYFQATGKMPIGFLWYHLRSGTTFFTYREEEDFLNLLLVVNHVVGNLAAESFPKNSTTENCRSCDYVPECWEKKIFPIASAEPIAGEYVGAEFIPNLIETDPNRQKRMNLKIPRERAAKPEEVDSRIPVLRNLPWWEEEREERYLMPRT